MKIAVFCAANDHIDPEYFQLTAEMGQWMGSHGHTLVFGGADRGLMREIGRSVHDAGGQTIGVIPDILQRSTRPEWLDIEIPCADLSQRKELMLSQSDVCVALPGGIGTLDEVFMVAGGNTVGYHRKRVIFYNMKGFWSGLWAVLRGLEEQKMVRGSLTDMFGLANSLDELTAQLSQC